MRKCFFRFLDRKFAELPCQAIPACLFGLMPPAPEPKYSLDAGKLFLKLCDSMAEHGLTAQVRGVSKDLVSHDKLREGQTTRVGHPNTWQILYLNTVGARIPNTRNLNVLKVGFGMVGFRMVPTIQKPTYINGRHLVFGPIQI